MTSAGRGSGIGPGTRRGCFITFEGVEGCGKSTQLARAETYIREKGLQVDVTREPGGTRIGEAIRAMLLNPEHTEMSHVAELMLYAAARAQHVDERIAPALRQGHVVLCDRFVDSTTAYQGGARGQDVELLASLQGFATRGCMPDRTLLFDIDARAALARVQGRRPLDRIEREPLAFHERVREAYLALAQHEPERVVIINAAQDEAAVFSEVRAVIEETLAPVTEPQP